MLRGGSGVWIANHRQSTSACRCGCHPLPLFVTSTAAQPPCTVFFHSFRLRNLPNERRKCLTLSGSSLFVMVSVTNSGYSIALTAPRMRCALLAAIDRWHAGHHFRLQRLSTVFRMPQWVHVSPTFCPQCASFSARSSAPSYLSRIIKSSRIACASSRFTSIRALGAPCLLFSYAMRRRGTCLSSSAELFRALLGLFRVETGRTRRICQTACIWFGRS